jgi:hypothetical protein
MDIWATTIDGIDMQSTFNSARHGYINVPAVWDQLYSRFQKWVSMICPPHTANPKPNQHLQLPHEMDSFATETEWLN